jgi:Uncharacterized lipoprotein
VSGRAALACAACLGLLLPALGGCGSAGLDVRYPAAGVSPAVLAAAPGRHVDVGPIADRRANTARIGVAAKNGEAVVTSRPVADIVREALVTELGRRGPAVAPTGRDVVLTVAIEDFRLDEIAGYGRAQYVGRVVIALSAIDGPSGATLLTRRYVGIKRGQADQPSDAVRRETMDAALARTMHDLATDPALAQVLGRSRDAS